ncbi:MAG: hypothetical protein ABIU05_18400, partial [Nitrospirales bacterium]
MASVFSYSTTSLHFPSDPKDQLNQSLRPEHGFHSPHHIPYPQFDNRTDLPAHRYDCEPTDPQYTSPLH